MKFSRTKTKTAKSLSKVRKRNMIGVGGEGQFFCLHTDEFSEVFYALNIRECKDD